MSHPFRFGVVTTGTPTRAAWISLAQQAEALGYASLLMPDRPSLGGLAPVAALATAAAATTTLRVGSYVFCNDYRHPLLLAKEAATLDLLSDGRFELGLGAGVAAPEYERLGVPFGEAGVRVSRVEEAVQIIKHFFTDEVVNFAGKYYTITGITGQPKPVQQPHPPIFIGSAGKRMLRMAAREAQSIAPTLKWVRPGSTPDDVSLEEKVGWIREAAGERFADLELCQTIYDIVITDSPTPIGAQAGGPMLPKRPLSLAQAVEQLQEQRAHYGFSYIQVHQGQLENFAPVVARLAGQ
jgi:probable F420-dependent oxidoreductase